MVSVDGIVPLYEVDTLLSTWTSFREDNDEPPGLVPEEEEHEVLHAAIARTVRARQKDTGTGKCRVGGVPDPSKGGLGQTKNAREKQK